MNYSLGPVLWYWPHETLQHFYRAAAESDAQIVYLGESVCSKRRATKYNDWMAMARALADAGKQVVLSTLALIQSPSELNELKRFVDNGQFMIEANDFGTAELAHDAGVPFVAGPSLNVYNAITLQLLLDMGMTRWCMPVELSRDWLENLLAQCEELGIRSRFEVEVLGYGYLPLALSARCFTARSENRSKDECETCCINYPQGRRLHTQDDRPVFVLNGIQTMSGYCYNLGNELRSMQGLVDIVRLSPSGLETLDVISQFRANETGQHPLVQASGDNCNGYWRRIAGLEQVG